MVSQAHSAPALLAIVAGMAISVLAAPSSSGQRADQTDTQGSNSGHARAQGSAQASARLMKELVETIKSDGHKRGVFQVELVNDNLYEWDVKLFFPDRKHGLHQDLVRLKNQGKPDHMLLRMTIPVNYPNEMPLVRIVYPVIWGSSTGALCMYLLSPQGWLPSCTMESLILTIMDHMVDNGSHRVDFDDSRAEYSGEGSDEELKNNAECHGWDKPRPEDKAWYEGPESRKNQNSDISK